MARVGSSTSTTITRIEKGLLILIFVISVGTIGVLTFYYVRSRGSLNLYDFRSGSGELWLTVIAISALGGLLIFSLGKQQGNGKIIEQS